METNSKQILEAQIRECYARVVWAHKTQEKHADILNRKNNCFKITQLILSVLSTTGILIIIFGDNIIIKIVSALFSAALVFINFYLKNYDLGRLAQKHSNTAADLWNIRESYLSLLTDIKANIIDAKTIQERRDNLQNKLSSIYKSSPRTIHNAYSKASKALKKNEEMTFSDEEIDNFLPTELKK